MEQTDVPELEERGALPRAENVQSVKHAGESRTLLLYPSDGCGEEINGLLTYDRQPKAPVETLRGVIMGDLKKIPLPHCTSGTLIRMEYGSSYVSFSCPGRVTGCIWEMYEMKSGMLL